MHKDLRKLFEALQRTKAFYVDELKKATEEELSHSPGDEQWNTLLLLDHLIKVENQTFRFVEAFDFNRSDQKTNLSTAFRSLLLKFSLRSNLKFKVPVKSVVPQKQDLNTSLKKWDQLREELENFLTTFPKEKLNYFVFVHPIAGKMNIKQALGFMEDHLIHHKHQLRKIQRSYQQIAAGE